MRFDPDCPFTEEEIAELNAIAYAPLDYEIQTLREQGPGFMHQSARPAFEAKMAELGINTGPVDLYDKKKIGAVLKDLSENYS